MLKFIILATVLALAASEENDWLKGRWLQAVSYPASAKCEWIEISLSSANRSVCANNTTALEISFLLKQKYARTVPVIMFEGLDGLKETVEQKCKYQNGYEESPIVFRKINENYIVGYGKYDSRMDQNKPEPNMAILLVKELPKLSELRKVMSEIEDLRDRAYTINCQPNYFANEVDD